MNSKLIKQAKQDLYEDFLELRYITDSYQDLLTKFKKELPDLQKNIRSEIIKKTKKEIIHQEKKLEDIKNDIKSTLVKLDKSSLKKNLTGLEERKYQIFEKIRIQIGLIGALMTSLDWQSPSFSHAVYSQAGRQIGKIKGTINDYKRDWHLDSKEFEKKYLKEYINRPKLTSFQAITTVSGMAAFTTILNFLKMKGSVFQKIMMGKSSYFQYKLILSQIFGHNLIEFDETNTKEIINLYKKHKSQAIFLDSLCNSANLPVPDIEKIIEKLQKDVKKETYLVIDNSCLSIGFQPFSRSNIKNKKLRIIMFESLMKYIHFGLDRATGGIIVSYGKDNYPLFEARKHLGTNIPDSSIYMFPTPKRKMLLRRLRKIERNTLFIAEKLQKFIQNNKSPIKQILYPGLENHPAYNYCNKISFRGGFVILLFKKKSIRRYKKFIKQIQKLVKKRNVEIIGGTSFGLNNTRVYLTSLWNDWGEPFVRISPGTENVLSIEKVADVLIASIKKT